MNKVISFSIYGSDQKYSHGGIVNAQLAGSLMPEWRCIFHLEESLPNSLENELVALGSTVVRMPKSKGAEGMFWRFRPVCDPRNSHVIVRDTDSRLSGRDIAAVRQWEMSGKTIHVMRDHPMHDTPILGGLWGAKPLGVPDFRNHLENYTPDGRHGEDQRFLTKYVYRQYKKEALIHDEIFKRDKTSISFPTSRIDNEYLGESISATENYDLSLRHLVRRFEIDAKYRFYVQTKSKVRKLIE